MPINVVSATEDHSIRFHQYHLEDMGRVRVRKYCEVEDREVTSDEIGKGYELTRTQVIPISDEDLRELPLPTAKAIEIEAFVPLESIDPIRIGEGYYLQPSQPVAAKPYKLLVQALSRSSKVAVAKYAWSGRERLGLLRVKDDVIVLHAMRWPDEIRDPAELVPPPVELTEDEIEGALALMDSMSRDDLEGAEFRDTYTDALARIIEAKREDKPLPETEATGGKVFDLMSALNESVARAKASRGGVWPRLHEVLLAKLRSANVLDFSRAAVDGFHIRALKGGAKTGRSPVDRGRTGSKHHLITDATGIPLATTLTGGNRNDVTQLIPLLQAVPPVRGKRGRPRRRPDAVLGDRGYDHDKYRRLVWDLGVKPLIARRGTEHGSGLGAQRWVVERAFAHLHWFRRLRIRWEIRADIHEAFLTLACALICWRRLNCL